MVTGQKAWPSSTRVKHTSGSVLKISEMRRAGQDTVGHVLHEGRPSCQVDDSDIPMGSSTGELRLDSLPGLGRVLCRVQKGIHTSTR